MAQALTLHEDRLFPAEPGQRAIARRLYAATRGLDVARTFFNTAWQEEFDAPTNTRGLDPKTRLQEWAQGRGLPLPAYAVVQRTGPDHAPSFTVAVTVQGFDPEQGDGRSRQDAEKAAALAMLLRREG